MIWKKYFIKELAKVFFLFIGSFYFLYVLIDYSAHSKTFHQEGIRHVDILLYYLFQLANRADILVPIALLIATVKVLTTLNVRNEIVALLAGGVPLKTLMRPFLLAGALSAALLYFNFQFIQPHSLALLDGFEDRFFKEHSNQEPIGALPLMDGSLLIYQKFDAETQGFFDNYWVKSSDLVYRIQTLYPYEKVPFGEGIAILKREEGQLKRIKAFDSMFFPEIQFDARALYTAIHPPRSQSLTELFSHLRWRGALKDKEAEAATIFFYKLMIPLASILVIFAPAPFCLRFGRHHPVFFIYALSLFGIITFFTFVNGCVILGESQVIPPFWAILTPLVLFFGFFGWKYAKL